MVPVTAALLSVRALTDVVRARADRYGLGHAGRGHATPEPVPVLGMGDRLACRAGLRERAVRGRGRARWRARRLRAVRHAPRRPYTRRDVRRSARIGARRHRARVRASRPRRPACCSERCPARACTRSTSSDCPATASWRGRRLAPARDRAGRVARDRDARAAGTRPTRATRARTAATRIAAASVSWSELGTLETSLATTGEAVLRDLPDVVRAPPHALAGTARRLDVRPGGRAALPAGGACRSSPTRAASQCSRCASTGGRSRSTTGSSRAARSTCTATPSIASLSRYGPGLVALRRSLAAASERGARRVEYLGGAEQFKRDLADRFEPLHQGFGLARGRAGHAYVARAQLAIAAAQAPQAQRAPAPSLSVRRASPAAATPNSS